MMRVIFSLLLLVVAPVGAGSYLLAVLLNQRNRALLFGEYLSLSFALGITLWSWLVLTGYILKLHVFLIGWIFISWSLISGFLAIRIFAYSARVDRVSSIEKVLWIVGILIGLIYFWVGAYQDPSADSFRHLAFIRRLASWGVMDVNVYVLSPNEPYDLLRGAYSGNSVHALYAWISQLFRIDPAWIWFHAPGILASLGIFSLYSFARVITGRSVVALISISFYLLFWAIAGSPLRALGHPESMMSVIVYPAFISLLLRVRIEQTPWRFIGIAGGSIAAFFLIHSQWWMFMLFTLGTWVIIALFRRISVKKLTTLLVLTLLASLPFVLFRWSSYAPIARELGEVLRYRYKTYIYSWGPFYGFLPKFVLSRWVVIFGIGAIGSGISRTLRQRISLALGVVLTMGIPIGMLTPLAGVIASLTTTTIAARMISLPFLWGPPLVAMSLWYYKGLLARKIPQSVRILGGIGLVGWLLYIFILRYIIKLLNLSWLPLKAWRHIFFMRPAVKLSILSWSFWIVLITSWLLGVLFFFWVKRYAIYFNTHILRIKRGNINIIGLTALLLLAPGSLLAPWYWLSSDRVYAQLYGPTLNQTLRSPTLQELLRQIPPRSLVITDHPNWLIAFREVYVANSVQGELSQGRSINDFLSSIFVYETSIQDILARLRALSPRPDYLLLSPRTSNLSWMKYDHYPLIFQKVGDFHSSETTYFNNIFVLYRLNLINISLLESAPYKKDNKDNKKEVHCRPVRLYPLYSTDLQPLMNRGNELYDGKWSKSEEALIWLLMQPTWFYIEFGPFSSNVLVTDVKIRIHRFTSSYNLKKAALFVNGEGQTFFSVEAHEFEYAQNQQYIEANFSVQQQVQYLRLALFSYGITTLGEVEIYGCQWP